MPNRILLLSILALFIFLPTFARADEKIDASQLPGVWVRTTTADIKAMDFQKDGKVLVYFGGPDQAETYTYSVMDDGRLNLAQGDGAVNNFFTPTLTTNQLTLKDAAGTIWQYRKLNAGQTLAAALTAQDQADQKTVADRNNAIPQFLARQDLVMVCPDGGKNAPPPAALALVQSGPTDFAGHVAFSSTPPKVDAVHARIENPDNNPDVAIALGNGTIDQPGPQGVWVFHTAGSPDAMTLESKVSFSEMFSTADPVHVVIKSDPDLHKQILDNLKTEVGRLNNLRTPVVAMLKDYVVLKGISRGMLQNQMFNDEFTLSLNPANNTWVGQAKFIDRTTGAVQIFPATAAVVIANQKPAIQIIAGNRLYAFLNVDPSTPTLNGTWQMPGGGLSLPAQLAITQTATAADRDALFAAQKKSLLALTPSTVFTATIDDQYHSDQKPANPIAVTLTVAPNGSITGSANYVEEGCTMTLAGNVVNSPIGPALRLHYTAGQPNDKPWTDVAAFINLVKNEQWLLTPISSPANSSDGSLSFSGFAVTTPTPNAMPVALHLTPYTDTEKSAITKALAAGAKFKVLHPTMSAPDSILEFTTDPTTGNINGLLASGGTHIGAYPNTKFSAPLKDLPGWQVIDAPTFRPNISRSSYSWKFFITQSDGQLYINAYGYSPARGPNNPINRFDLVPIKQ